MADLNLLKFYMQKSDSRLIRERLLEPFPPSWDKFSRNSYYNGISAIEESLKTDENALFFLHRVSEFLINKDHAPDWVSPFLKASPFWGTFFNGTEPDHFFKGFWTAVPVLIVAGSQKALRYFLVGKAEGPLKQDAFWPGWVEPLIDQTAKDTIFKAAKLVDPEGLAENLLTCFPLVVPNGHRQIKGESLGLPLALGFKMVLSGRKFPQKIAVTGAIDQKGCTRQVSHLDLKFELAQEKKFKLFVFPFENAGQVKDQIDTLKVNKFGDAVSVLSHYQPGNDIVLLLKMRNSAQAFTDNCRSVPVEWLTDILDSDEWPVLKKEISNSPERFLSILGHLKEEQKVWHLAKAHLIGSILGPNDGRFLAESLPGHWFQWCTQNLALCNHLGRVADATIWAQAAEKVKQNAVKSDENMKNTSDFYNNLLVSLRHNQYCFKPELPDDLQKYLLHLEKQYKNDLGLHSDATAKRLGEIYGTVTQNYAFCGAGYIDQTLRYSELAQKAFGNGNVKELKGEWIRQYHYLVYALLDAGDISRAKACLMIRLQSKSWEEVEEKIDGFSNWEHALLARFAAESGKILPTKRNLVEKAEAAALKIEKVEHPWQLWRFNMGRIYQEFGDHQAARQMFEKSLNLCILDQFGPTVRVMALLPLAQLYAHNPDGKIDFNKYEKPIFDAARDLDPIHFAFLKTRPFGKALEYVYTNMHLIFPFSYR